MLRQSLGLLQPEFQCRAHLLKLFRMEPQRTARSACPIEAIRTGAHDPARGVTDGAGDLQLERPRIREGEREVTGGTTGTSCCPRSSGN